MEKKIKIGNRLVGDGEPCFIVAEIGINHNGSLEIVRKLIDMAKNAGCDAVKFQKRTPDICVPEDQKYKMRETPWGEMTYIDYRNRMEFSLDQYNEINCYCCRDRGIMWFVSCWDLPSVDFMENNFNFPCYKVASACLTDKDLLYRIDITRKPILLSTGMSTLEEIDQAVFTVNTDKLILLHCNSSYPAKIEELNLRMIPELRNMYEVPVGYSGHETGVFTTLCAVAMGACVVERHITLDRSMWGTDQSVSLERTGLNKLVEEIRDFERARGDGIKIIYQAEMAMREKLRR